ncbi:MAG TPA: AI-2E family transporter [Chloroflexota bacterium]|nr:AI-2E family transporter [Chloroflexota bacterium]
MNGSHESTPFPDRTKVFVAVVLLALSVVFLLQVRSILSPFLWALFASYLFMPIVNYLNYDGRMPRLWCVMLIYASIAILLLAGSRFLYPRAVEQGTLFLEDIPRLQDALISRVGPRPLGVDIAQVISQILNTATGYTHSASNTSHLLENALATLVKLFLFLVSTFYLLMDGPRLRQAIQKSYPPMYRDELIALGRKINLTWQQYIRGELLLFGIMATVTTIGLTILGVPGAIFLGVVSGVLELLPLVGPITAGAIAVSVAYFNPSIPWGLSQVAYAGIVALMYFVLRQAEDYFVVPHVIGRAVRLHPLVVLFALTTMGVFGGIFGLLVAVPLAASAKAILSYLYAKLLDQPVQFEPVRTIGGGIIEIPIYVSNEGAAEAPGPESASPAQRVDAGPR